MGCGVARQTGFRQWLFVVGRVPCGLFAHVRCALFWRFVGLRSPLGPQEMTRWTVGEVIEQAAVDNTRTLPLTHTETQEHTHTRTNGRT